MTLCPKTQQSTSVRLKLRNFGSGIQVLSQWIQETLLNRHFGRGLPKILWKSNFIFVFEPSLFWWKLLRVTKNAAAGTIYQWFFMLLNMFRSFLSLVIHHPTIFDALIQRGLWVIPKITIGNLWKPFYDAIFIQF